MARLVDFAKFQELNSLASRPTLKFKEGVAAIAGYWVEAVEPLMQTAPIMQEEEVWITAIVDGQHKKTSRHFSGDAIDVRFVGDRPGAIWTVLGPTPPQLQLDLAKQWAARLRRALGADWDVVVEARHLHLEYDPK